MNDVGRPLPPQFGSEISAAYPRGSSGLDPQPNDDVSQRLCTAWRGIMIRTKYFVALRQMLRRHIMRIGSTESAPLRLHALRRQHCRSIIGRRQLPALLRSRFSGQRGHLIKPLLHPGAPQRFRTMSASPPDPTGRHRKDFIQTSAYLPVDAETAWPDMIPSRRTGVI
jgi:hypothetical protein